MGQPGRGRAGLFGKSDLKQDGTARFNGLVYGRIYRKPGNVTPKKTVGVRKRSLKLNSGDAPTPPKTPWHPAVVSDQGASDGLDETKDHSSSTPTIGSIIYIWLNSASQIFTTKSKTQNRPKHVMDQSKSYQNGLNPNPHVESPKKPWLSHSYPPLQVAFLQPSRLEQLHTLQHLEAGGAVRNKLHLAMEPKKSGFRPC